MRDAVEKHSYVHDRFVCITNQKLKNVETVPFTRNWPGWWSKLELFRAGLFERRVAYFDLDTMLISDISDLISAPQDFICITNWKGSGTHVNSGMMCWNANLDFSRIYTEFHPRAIPEYEKRWERWGDQGFIQDQLRVPFASYNELYPGRIVSYKWHIRRQGFVPKEASVVAFHGKPRPLDVGWKLPERK